MDKCSSNLLLPDFLPKSNGKTNTRKKKHALKNASGSVETGARLGSEGMCRTCILIYVKDPKEFETGEE